MDQRQNYAGISGDTDLIRILTSIAWVCQNAGEVSWDNRLMDQHVAEERIHLQDNCSLQVHMLVWRRVLSRMSEI